MFLKTTCKNLFAAIALLYGFSLAAPAWSQTMRVHVIDVGQGAATLVEFPCAAILVDTGGERNGEFDGIDELSDYLEDFFTRRSDLNRTLHSLILTHPHIDHTRGVNSVLSRYRILNAVTNGSTARSSGSSGQNTLHRKISTAEDTANQQDDIGFVAANIRSIPRDVGLTNDIIDPVNCPTVDPKITLLWGRHQANPGWTQAAFKNQNNQSVIIRIDFGASSYLITGDLEDHAIASLIAHYRNSRLLDVDAYQVGHHGSANGTTDALLRAITPKLAVIAMGVPERRIEWTAWAYGHPRKVIVDMLERHVTQTRSPVSVKVAPSVKRFQTKRLTKAIYGTGWDGTVVLEADTQGAWRAVPPASLTPDLLNVNVASVEDLTQLPSIGERRARAIVDHRTQRGRFSSLDQLTEVRGIGPATLTLIRDLVTIGN